MLVILILSAIITYKLGAVDRQYAKRGETPPGYRLIEKWMDQRKARGQMPAGEKPVKYGMWRYFWQRWQAMWETLSDEHAIRDAARKQQRLEAAANGQTPPRRPSLREQAGTYWQWVLDTVVAPVGEKKPEPEAAPDDSAQSPAPVDQTVTDDPRIACEDCGQTLIERDGNWQHPSSSGCPAAQTAPDETPPVQTLDEVRRDMQTQPTELAATTEGEPMTTTQQAPVQQSGEVVGLMAAINYAGQVAAAHESHSTGGGEGYRASLGQAEVGPETIQSAAAAQEASEIAGAAWRLHEAKLREQLAAKEATTAETGKKEFLLSE